VLGGVLAGVEKAINKEKPDALLVGGDTDSHIAAPMARRMKVPANHIEAGNRCFRLNVPKEENRSLVQFLLSTSTTSFVVGRSNRELSRKQPSKDTT
jgi:UDP-N-acetylglucosamine 2-epimerase